MKADGTNAPAVAKPRDSVGALIERMKPQLERALPKHVTPDRMARVALTAIRQSPKLQRADPMSLIAAVMVAAQLGLEPNTPLGQCFIIPYKDQATFQVGYKGILDLAHRSGQYKRISAYAVDKADHFAYEYGLDPSLVHTPADKPSGEISHYYAVYELANGGRDFKVWSRSQVEEHAKKYSQAYRAGKKDSPWFTAFDSMAKKTVLIDLLRYGPKSIELQTAAEYDNAAVRVNENDPDLEINADWETVEDEPPAGEEPPTEGSST